MSKSLSNLPAPAFDDPKHHLRIYQGDCLEILAQIPESTVDLVFADPPYFLSNGGITCHAGRMVSVNKGDWDKSRGPDANHEFNRAWLAACQRVLKPNGSIWVSGTSHVIHSVGFAMQQLGFKLLNDISWVKPNPPPNLSCRYFTHSTETIIWAAKNSKSRHTFNYRLMKEANRGKQMKSVRPNPGRKNSASTPPKSPSLSSSASSSPPPTKATSSSTRSPAAAPQSSPHSASVATPSAANYLPNSSASPSAVSVPIWYRSIFLSPVSSFPLIRFQILWIDPIAPT